MDILLANDSMPEYLFHNRGNGTFEEVGLTSGAGLDGNGNTFAGMGVDFADYNNDGWPDIIITDLAYQRYALYNNLKDGTFDYSTSVTGLSRFRCCIPVGACVLWITITTGGRTCSSSNRM